MIRMIDSTEYILEERRLSDGVGLVFRRPLFTPASFVYSGILPMVAVTKLMTIPLFLGCCLFLEHALGVKALTALGWI